MLRRTAYAWQHEFVQDHRVRRSRLIAARARLSRPAIVLTLCRLASAPMRAHLRPSFDILTLMPLSFTAP
jgi:hypothetical protein